MVKLMIFTLILFCNRSPKKHWSICITWTSCVYRASTLLDLVMQSLSLFCLVQPCTNWILFWRKGKISPFVTEQVGDLLSLWIEVNLEGNCEYFSQILSSGQRTVTLPLSIVSVANGWMVISPQNKKKHRQFSVKKRSVCRIFKLLSKNLNN